MRKHKLHKYKHDIDNHSWIPRWEKITLVVDLGEETIEICVFLFIITNKKNININKANLPERGSSKRRSISDTK